MPSAPGSCARCTGADREFDCGQNASDAFVLARFFAASASAALPSARFVSRRASVGSSAHVALRYSPGSPPRRSDQSRKQLTVQCTATDVATVALCRRAACEARGIPRTEETPRQAHQPDSAAHPSTRRLPSRIAARLFLHCLHHDPVELAAHQRLSFFGSVRRLRRDAGERAALLRQPRARPRRLLLADDPQHLVEAPPRRAASCRTASCRSAARRAARPANRCRCACRCRARSISACSGLM